MGRGITLATVNVPAMSVSMSPNRNQVTEDAFSIATQSAIYGGTYSMSGSVTAAYRPTTLRTLTRAVLGTSSTGSIITSGAFDKAYTCNIADDGHNYSFTGVVVNSMELTLNNNEFAKVTYNWMGKRAATGSAPGTPSFTEKIPMFYNALLSFKSGSLKVKGITLKIDRPINPDFILGSEYAYDWTPGGQITVTGSLTLSNDEYAILDNVMLVDTGVTSIPDDGYTNALDSGTLEIVLTAPDALSVLETITIDKAYVTQADISASGLNVFEKKVNFVAEIIDASTNISFV